MGSTAALAELCVVPSSTFSLDSVRFSPRDAGVRETNGIPGLRSAHASMIASVDARCIAGVIERNRIVRRILRGFDSLLEPTDTLDRWDRHADHMRCHRPHRQDHMFDRSGMNCSAGHQQCALAPGPVVRRAIRRGIMFLMLMPRWCIVVSAASCRQQTCPITQPIDRFTKLRCFCRVVGLQ